MRDLTNKDFEQLKNRGVTEAQISQQLDKLEGDKPYTDVIAAAKIGDGICQIDKSEAEKYINLYHQKREEKTIVKFIPASGMASRMFDFLYQFINHYEDSISTVSDYQKQYNCSAFKRFVTKFDQFPFAEEIKRTVTDYFSDYIHSNECRQWYYIARVLLDTDKLDYTNFPKALFGFHKYDNQIKTSLEEHVSEFINYGMVDSVMNIHLTILKKYQKLFDDKIEEIQAYYIDKGYQVNITYSFQNTMTDTVSINLKNKEIIRDQQGEIYFRSGGHGALIYNLDVVDAAIIFIKNIDNISHRKLFEKSNRYEKILAGKLLDIQSQIFEILNDIDQQKTVSKTILQKLLTDLSIPFSVDFEHRDIDIRNAKIREYLDRPIRVCGMVANDGQVGGGPFWVRDQDGTILLQIVEMTQINTEDANNIELINQSTHFNPVDIVCSKQDYQGNQYQIEKYINTERYILSEKKYEGQPIKILELPGLWNGGMANWNTVFVEIPKDLFNPVKIVNNLLDDNHQG